LYKKVSEMLETLETLETLEMLHFCTKRCQNHSTLEIWDETKRHRRFFVQKGVRVVRDVRDVRELG
jgi:hypothetical protein